MRGDLTMTETSQTIASGVELAPHEAEIEALTAKVNEKEALLRAPKVFDRHFLIMRGSMAQRQAYFSLASRIKAPVLARRAELGQAYCEANADNTGPNSAAAAIRANDAFVTVDLSGRPLVKLAVEEGLRLFEETGGLAARRPGKGSLEYVSSSAKPAYGVQSAAFKLATSPDLLVPITRYFGALPILTGYSIALSRNDTFHRKSSQRLHFDPEDRTQMKVFIYITDVDERSGPFLSAGAAASEAMFNRADFILDRLDDSIVPDGSIRQALGPAGTASFCDTCRCLHAGGRLADRPRLMLSIEYNLPTYLWAPLYEGDGEMRDRMAGVAIEPASEIESALLGRSLVYSPLVEWSPAL